MHLCSLVLLAYVVVAVGTTWPLTARIATHLPGGSVDTWVHYWNGWWVRRALIEGGSPFYTRYLFHPHGISLVYHNFAWLTIGTWLLLSPWAGGVIAYNLPLLLTLALSGLAAFLLAYELTGDGLASLLAGLIYQCWPFRMVQLDHPNLISTLGIPLFLLFLIRAVRFGRRRDGLLVGAFLALVGYTRWQLLIPAGIIGGVYLTCVLPARWASRRRWVPSLLLAGAITALALAPPAMLLLNQQRTAPADLVKEAEETSMQTDLLAYLTPSAAHPVLGGLTEPAYDRYYHDRSAGRRYSPYVGVTVLILGLLGVWKAGRSGLPWVATALVLIALALGWVLRVDGHLYPAVPMPYRLASRLFVVRLLRFPDRFNLFLALPTAMLAAHGASYVLDAARRRGRGTCPERSRRATGKRSPLSGELLPVIILGLLGAAIVFEYLVAPVPLKEVDLSSFYARLADEPGDFAVLNLPIDPQKSKRYMFTQTAHHRPILQGKTARFPEGAYAYLDAHPMLRVLRQHSEFDPRLTDVGRQLASLAEDDVRYLILHKNEVGADRVAHWRRYLLTSPRFEDEEIAAYVTRPEAGRDFTLTEELAPGLGIVQVITSTDCLNPGRVLEVDVGWGATAEWSSQREDHSAMALESDLRVALALVSEEGEVAQSEIYPLSPGWPTSEWSAGAVAWGYYVLPVLTYRGKRSGSVEPSLPAGVYTITLALVDPETEKPGFDALLTEKPGFFAVGRATVQQAPCQLPVPAGAEGVNAVFGDDLRLLGYQVERDEDRLMVTLHWRSERRMETDYKIFVHVFDPATGVPVAQDDAMPHRWGYPTTFWGPGEVVKDDIPIYLDGAPPGRYGIAVGVYNPETTDRLPVVDARGESHADGRLVLPGETVEVR